MQQKVWYFLKKYSLDPWRFHPVPSAVCQSSQLLVELQHLSSLRWKKWGAKRWEQSCCQGLGYETWDAAPEDTAHNRGAFFQPGDAAQSSLKWTSPPSSSHTTSSPANAIRTLLQPPHGTHSNLLNARNGTPLIGIFRLYSIKGEKKRQHSLITADLFILHQKHWGSGTFISCSDHLTPLSITGWIITAWNVPRHFPAPWRSSPCPHPSDNAIVSRNVTAGWPSSHHGPEWPWTTVNSALTSCTKLQSLLPLLRASSGWSVPLWDVFPEKCTFLITGKVDDRDANTSSCIRQKGCCSQGANLSISRKGASNWNGSSWVN